MATQIDPITGLPSSNVQTVYAGDKPISSSPSPAPVISATKIGTTAMTPVPSPVVPTVNPNQTAQIANYTETSATDATTAETQRLQAEADAQKARGQAMMTDYAQAQSALGGKAGDLATAYNTKDETGNSVNSLAAQLRQLNAQAQAIQLDNLAKGQAEINKATGQNITQQAVARNTADVTRENLINMATIGIKTAIAKADYDTAKSYADQVVEAKYSQMEANLKSKEIQLKWAMEQDLAPAQKKLADAQARQIEADRKAVEEKKAQEKAIQDMIITATPNAPADIISKAQKLADSGASSLAVAQSLGVYGGDYLKNELLKEQIKTQQNNRRIDNEKLAQSQQTSDVTNINGKPLKVSNAEITNLNETLTARDSVTSLVNQFKKNIADYGTQTLFGKAAGDREALRTNLLLAIKNMEKTGALDAGTINVLEGTIPSSKFFATEQAQTAALDTLLNTVTSKTDSYINSYKGTTAETDPRTKRAYEQNVVSTGNKAADDYFRMTSQALTNINTSLSTPNAMTAGYVDNQK